jgi:hypothetical protein
MMDSGFEELEQLDLNLMQLQQFVRWELILFDGICVAVVRVSAAAALAPALGVRTCRFVNRATFGK